MIRGIILEGIPGSGKTAVFRHLRRLLADNMCPALFLSEACTERMLEPLKNASLSDSLKILDQVLNLILHFKNLSCKSGVNMIKYFILERFHMSHCLDIAGKDAFDKYLPVDRRLHELNTTVFLLTMNQDVILQRSVVLTKQNRPESWTRYLSSIGKSDQEISDYYSQQQDHFLSLSRQSKIPLIQMDTTPENWSEVAENIIKIVSIN